MDLKTFIEETLVQIIEETKAASEKIGQSKEEACVNPQGETDLSTQKVFFDVALTVEESQGSTLEAENKTGGRIQIAKIFGIGQERGKINSEELCEIIQSVCHIKFEIPIRLPVTIDRKKNELNARKYSP